MRKIRKDQKFGNWTLVKRIGRGGNGEVWSCTDGLQTCAIKFLTKTKPKAFQRFADEAIVLEENYKIEGIINVIEKNIVNTLEEVPYYVMPLGETGIAKMKNKPIEFIIDGIIQLAETLAELHSLRIFHRDIKPPNVLFLNGKFCFTDFGLVDYPNKKDISHNNEEIGAKWTMAPEMRRSSSNADLSKADIYSLAKTLWIFLMDDSKGFDGQYSFDSIISLKRKYNSHYTTPIDKLLSACTDNDPNRRYSIHEFITTLKDWKKLNSEFHSRNVAQWFEIQTQLFPTSIPNRVFWTRLEEIVNVLKTVCTYSFLNHMFMPRSGGMDLLNVELSVEEDCIELDFGYIVIAKPKRLIFESFGHDHHWNYFRLELDELRDSGVYVPSNDTIPYCQEHNSEIVSELAPGIYYNLDFIEYKHEYDSQYYITESARSVRRMFRGTYVIFNKSSPYNRDTSTYDGRHNKMNTDEFRAYIQKSVNFSKAESKSTTTDTDMDREEVSEANQREKIAMNYQNIYRCGWCGNIVNEQGNKLDEEEQNYSWRLLNKFGGQIVIKKNGYCCKHRWSSQ